MSSDKLSVYSGEGANKVTHDQAPPQQSRVSTVLGRRLGGELLQLRLESGLTQGQAAKVITASTAKVAKMESGWVPMRDPDIRALCDAYTVEDPATVGSLLELARVDRERRKAKGWWTDFPQLGNMREYVTLEDGATAIRSWQLTLIPGLLQTGDYVRAIRNDNDRDAANDSDEQFVQARLARQQRLTDDPTFQVNVVIYEAALRQRVGGPGVMRKQLAHLSTVAQLPNISVRVLPFSSGALHGMNCTFNVLSFAEPGAMDVIYMEVPFQQVWIEGGKGATQYAGLFEKIASRALDESASHAYIHQISKEL